EVAARQEAVRELAAMDRFREELAARGVESGTRGRGAEPFLVWAEEGGTGPSRALMLAGHVLPVITLGALLGPRALGMEESPYASWAWLVPVAVQLVLLGVLRPALEPILAPASSRAQPFGRYVPLFRLAEAQRFQAPLLVKTHA